VMHYANHPRGWKAMAAAVAIAIAGALLALGAGASGPAEAAGKFKTLTKTFHQPTPISIPSIGDASPYPSQKDLKAFPKGTRILDVDLTLRDFGHSDPDDVDVMLVHRGVNRTVLSDAGGTVGFTGKIVLNDEAAAALPDDGPLVSGSFKPSNYDGVDIFPPPAPQAESAFVLKGFDGKDPDGSWQLFVRDDAGQGAGSIADGYSLRIKAKVPTN
jgi:hypothetical protein